MSRIDDLIQQHCPNGVEYRHLSELARRNSGTPITAARMKALRVDGGAVRIFAGGNTIADVPEDAIPAAHITRDPSIIVKSRGHIGFAFYDRPFSHKNELWSYTVTSPGCDQRFVYYFLVTQAPRLEALARANSVKLPQLTVGQIDAIRIPVPPIEVQREIVRVLDTFQSLEAELEAELEARRRQYAHYRDSLMTFHESVARVPIGELGEIYRGRRFTKEDYVSDGLPAIHYGELYTEYGISATVAVTHVRRDLEPSLRFARPGDVVIAEVGETVEDVGKATAWLGDSKVAIHDGCYGFRHSMSPKFVAHYLQTAAYHAEKSRHVARAKVKRLSMTGIKQVRLPVPPLDEQERIVEILDKFDALVNDLSVGLPAELAARRKQYEYYRDRLLTFEEAV